MKIIKKIGILIALLTIPLSCNLFEEPYGEAELLDTYTRNEKGYIEEYFSFGSSSLISSDQEKPKPTEVLISYICTTIKITNSGNKNIYNSTINVSAKAGERTYYKTISLDITIAPGCSIYIPIEIEKPTKELLAVNSSNDSDWDLTSFKILSINFK